MFLGIDIGTGSSKAVLADADGYLLDSEVVAHEVSYPRPGWAEFDAEGTGWTEVARLCRALFDRHDAGAVAGVCVSAMGPAWWSQTRTWSRSGRPSCTASIRGPARRSPS